MLATKNPRWKITTIFAVAALVSFIGCTPAGSRALVQGDELLRNGKAAEAIEKLKRATRLMPDEPRAWNLLGLAYHHSGEPQLALQAYRQALAKDRSNIVAVTHYNLGTLLIEQGNAAGAIDELRSYTLITNSVPGLVKLRSAQLRLRQLDSAERSFAAALRLDAKSSEALNGVGVIHAQRNQRDAAQYFTSALQANPKYAPAVLNSGLLAQQNAATKPAALERYRDYLALQPQSSRAEAVKSLVRQLEIELPPARTIPTTILTQASASAKTNFAAPQLANPLQATTAQPRAAAVATNVRSYTAVTKTNVPPPLKTNAVAAAANAVTPLAVLPVTIVAVTTDPPPRIAPAEPLVSTPTPRTITDPAPRTAPGVSPPVVAPTAEEPSKRGFFTRLNPFRGRPRSVTNDPPRTAVFTPSTNTPPAEPALPVAAKATFPRYSYRTPHLPEQGNRANAERAMQQAVKAHRAGKTNEALLTYQLALNADPTYFDAQYNSALLALQTGELNRSLAGWETALALQPDSLNARYNFALALKQANYPKDAAIELEKLLEAKPSDSRAHLSLANLYAQHLNEREKARAHYLKVLELEPRNPQAPSIRFWLVANPEG